MRTLNDLDPHEMARATQHIPRHNVKRHGSGSIEIYAYPDAESANEALSALLNGVDPTVEAVQPHCHHVCLN